MDRISVREVPRLKPLVSQAENPISLLRALAGLPASGGSGKGEWEAVPMCAMNQNRWSDLYEERLLARSEIPATVE